MKTVFHKADTRGVANHGWLKSFHTFSFADYHNPERVNFGVLRVINEDRVQGSKGFGTHPHRDMEIISIPLSGSLEHKDSMGNGSVIKRGEVQVMSAGTGVTHSEFNASDNEIVHFLQIWVFSREKGVKPRYQQEPIAQFLKENEFQQILSPNQDDQGVWIHQDAWFSWAEFSEDTKSSYTIKRKDNGAYFFVISGSVEIAGQKLNPSDGFGVWETDEVSVNASKDAVVLVIDVPMELPEYLFKR